MLQAKKPVNETWRCPVCAGAIQLTVDLYLAAQVSEMALREEAKVPLTCIRGHRVQLSEHQQQDLVAIAQQWTPKGRAQG
jgi:hypothetical protein